MSHRPWLQPLLYQCLVLGGEVGRPPRAHLSWLRELGGRDNPFFFFVSKMCLLGWFPTHLDSGYLIQAPSEGAPFCKPCFSSRRLTEDSGAASTQNHHCAWLESVVIL